MARGICDRCGFEYDLHDLRKEWTGLMVCAADWDAKPATLRPPRLYPEGLPLRNARPEPAPNFVVVPDWGLSLPFVPDDAVLLIDDDGSYVIELAESFLVESENG